MCPIYNRNKENIQPNNATIFPTTIFGKFFLARVVLTGPRGINKRGEGTESFIPIWNRSHSLAIYLERPVKRTSLYLQSNNYTIADGFLVYDLVKSFGTHCVQLLIHFKEKK